MRGESPQISAAGSEILVYEAPDGEVRVDVRLEEETVWLSLNQMAELFGRDKSVISRHLRNVFQSGELEREAIVAKNATVQKEGRRSVTREIEFFNLDAILSVGYRVNSKRGTQFRIWATRTLREHLVRGYTLNEKRLAERGLKEARDTLDLLARTLKQQALVDDTGAAVLDLIKGYADTWRLLLEYDEDRLAAPPGSRPAVGVLDKVFVHRVAAAVSPALLMSGLTCARRRDAPCGIRRAIRSTKSP